MSAQDGLNPDSNSDIRDWLAEVTRPILTEGIAVVVIDHIPKATDSRPRYPIGGGQKLGAVTGAAYFIECKQPLAPPSFGYHERTGKSLVWCMKDRPGAVRALDPHGRRIFVAAVLEITAFADATLSGQLVEPDEVDASGADRAMLARVVEAVEEEPGINNGNLRALVGGKADAVNAAIRMARNTGRIKVRKEGRANCHYPADFDL